MRRGDGGVQELEKKTLLASGEGGLHIKYRRATRCVHAHYSQADTDTPSPTEGQSLSLSLSLGPGLIQSHPPIQNSSVNIKLIAPSWMSWLDVTEVNMHQT